jgi:hypothetical protein
MSTHRLNLMDLIEDIPRALRVAAPAAWDLGMWLARSQLRGLGRIEDAVLRLLAQPLYRVESPPRPVLEGRTLREELADLLAAAVEQSSDASERAVFGRLLGQLVPEEASMLAALARDGPAAVVHVVPRGRGGRGLRNASSLGRRAGVTMQSLVPSYVEHLLDLGLVECGPEQPGLDLQFEILLAETIVREALDRARSGVVGPQVVRKTLRLSELGDALWAASGPDASP